VSLRERLDGLSGYVALAAVLFVFSVLGFLVEIQSSDKVLWTGTKVVGSEQNGIVFYRYRGEQYSLDGSGFTNRARVSVYLDPSNPNNAQTNGPFERVVDLGFTAIPFTLSILVMGVGITRRRFIDRKRVTEVREYGGGLDPEYVEAYLKRMRQRDS
jgi:hypothetical protein